MRGKVHEAYQQCIIASLVQRCSIPCLLDVSLLDLVRKPRWAVCRLVDNVDASGEAWTLLVPRSRRRMSVCPRVAAFSAAPRGCRLANTWLVSFPPFMRTKYFFSPIGYTSCRIRSVKVIIFPPSNRYTALHIARSGPFQTPL